MARLTRRPLCDDDVPAEIGSSKHKSHSISNGQYATDAAVGIIIPTGKKLVLDSGTPTRSTRRIRRLKSSNQETNVLFQPWSREDDDGSQARYQKIMRESPAKMGLFTEFERDMTAQSPIKSSRKWNRSDMKCQTTMESDVWLPSLTQGKQAHLLGLSGKPIDNGKAGTLACRPLFIPRGIRNGSLKTPAHQHIAQERDIVGDLAIDDNSASESTTTICLKSETTRMSLSSASNNMDGKHEDVPETLAIYSPSTCLESGKSEDGPLNSSDAINPPKDTSQNIEDDRSIDSRTMSDEELSTSDHELDDVVKMWEKMHLTSSPQSGKIGISGADESLDSFSHSGRRMTSFHATQKFRLNQGQAQAPVDCCDSQQLVPISLPVPPLVDQKQKCRGSPSKKSFQAARQALAEDFLSELDKKLTNGRITELTKATGGVKLNWTKNLNTTAGRANWRREVIRSGPSESDGTRLHEEFKHHATIDLADKVIDNETKLLNVLAHEFCHLATFMISGTIKNPHGKDFKNWASKCSLAFGNRGIHVTTRHSYDIDFKYLWRCVSCGLEYKRHSKSIDIQRHRCGSCKSELKQVRPAPSGSKGNNDASGRSHYQLFVRDQMQLVKKENPHVLQQELMKIIAKRWAAKKEGGNVSS
ncbi:hypothetical protein E4U41_007733 [Claviceps citrina]|nr:hypothetical protein E4U41_007733 [Claviceps citrina]